MRAQLTGRNGNRRTYGVTSGSRCWAVVHDGGTWAIYGTRAIDTAGETWP